TAHRADDERVGVVAVRVKTERLPAGPGVEDGATPEVRDAPFNAPVQGVVNIERARAIRLDHIAHRLRVHRAINDKDVVIHIDSRADGLAEDAAAEGGAFAGEHGRAGQALRLIVDDVVVDDRWDGAAED